MASKPKRVAARLRRAAAPAADDAPLDAAERRVVWPTLLQRRRSHVLRVTDGPAVPAGSNGIIPAERMQTATSEGEPVVIHAIGGYVATVYLVEYPQRGRCAPHMLLLDTGATNDSQRVEFYMAARLGCEPLQRDRFSARPGATDVRDERQVAYETGAVIGAHVKLAVATHAHGDHAGSSARLRRCGVPLVAPENVNGFYRGAGGRLQWCLENVMLGAFARDLGRPATEYTWHDTRIVSDTAPLRDGDALPGFSDWRAIHIPGHTSHMVALYHTPSHTLYTSDLLIHHRGQFRPPTPVDIPEAYAYTLTRLASLPVRHVLCAHGGVVDVSARPGGWRGVLDEVRQFAPQPGSFADRGGRMLVFSPEPRHWQSTDLPRGPLPGGDATPRVASRILHRARL